MPVINVNLRENTYNVRIEQGLLQSLGSFIRKFYPGELITLITDSTVDSLYGDKLTTSLKDYNIHKIIIAPGEKSKSLNTLSYIYNELAKNKADRSSLIAAFGGGVVGDLAGFAAATYMRGVPYIQIPTTVMSQLDSSIGGKTAVNIEAGKNLAGCFYQPKEVYIDTTMLQTLDDRLFSEGLAEAVKYGAIKDVQLFDKLLSMKSIEDVREHIDEIIYKCAKIKCSIVSTDEFDKGERMLLNFGHTLGHAIEKYYSFDKYSHGEAVGLGMLMITRCSEAAGITKAGTAHAIEEALSKFKLPISYDGINIEQLIELISIDKKAEENSIRLILLKELGHSTIQKMSKTDIREFIVIPE